MKESYNVLDLFSGIGGFSLGLERAGMKTVAFCEIDKYCQKVLEKHWPDVPIYNDVRSLDYEGSVDVICGGFPCQPFSTAGKQEGKEDDRYLWPAMLDLVRKHRPGWFLGENVTGIVGMALDDVLADLEREAYTTRTFIIPACAVNAPHRRDRVWIVANSSGSDGRRKPRKYDRSQKKEGLQERNKDKQSGVTSEVCAGDVANTLGNRLQGLCKSRSSRAKGSGVNKGREASRTTSQNRQDRGFWEIEPDVGRVADGVSDRTHRLRSLGNAVVPQIPEIIGRAIMEIEQLELGPVGKNCPIGLSTEIQQ